MSDFRCLHQSSVRSKLGFGSGTANLKSFGNFKRKVDRWHYYYLHLPCTAVIDFGSDDTNAKLVEEDRNQGG